MTNLIAQNLQSLETKLDTFYGRHIAGLHARFDAWEFQDKLREIEREYDRIVGYRRGFREAMIEVGMPLAMATDTAFVSKATATLIAELETLATACDTASRGRPKKAVLIRLTGAWRSVPANFNPVTPGDFHSVKLSCKRYASTKQPNPSR